MMHIEKKLYVIIIALFYLIDCSDVFAVEPTINIYTEELYPLSFYNSDTQQVEGFSTELIRTAMNDSGLNYTIEIIPWARAYTYALNKPNTIIFSMARTAERENEFIWLQKIRDLSYGIYTSSKDLIGASLEDVKNLHITVTKNGLSHSILSKQGFTNFIFINNNERIVQLIERNRMKVLFTSSLWINENKKKLTKQLYLLPNIKLDNSVIGLYFAINKNTDPKILDTIRKGFMNIMKDGRFDKIIEPYNK